MMFLNKNYNRLMDQMDANPMKVEEKDVSRHRLKTTRLLCNFYPRTMDFEFHKKKLMDFNAGNERDYSYGFAELEKLVGHDLLVTAIMASAKNSKSKNIFAKGIPDLQWTNFEADEKRKGRKTPDVNAVFVPISKPAPNQKSETISKKERKEGKLFLNMTTVQDLNSNSPFLCFSVVSEAYFKTADYIQEDENQAEK